ncbi:hypothetical protein PWY87_16605 [Kribbella solani]|uniref:hypothetical protein n=1 Tax=Kribbella solani TaxID=236067 RepID=UPI0029B1BA95|nr:hypothetical protein [Kribbella solani]MDX2973285.1 hypothetical protein [Kribbella solani]MDX3003311.1 hypothetical protein [Kribbella solani]
MNTTERPVPRWAYRLAHLIPFMVLPSGLWRLGLVFGSSMGLVDANGTPTLLEGAGGKVYVVGLTIFSELIALTALGMVSRWGEVVPRWIPFIGGWRVHPYAAIIPATLGALSLIAIWTYGFRDAYTGHFIPFESTNWKILMLACYSPLNLWGPALLVVTWAYYRRRRDEPRPAAGNRVSESVAGV